MNQPTNSIVPITLFTIRLWTEDNCVEQPEWRGKITNLRNQEVRYFRDSETLYGVLVKMVIGDDRHFTSLGPGAPRIRPARRDSDCHLTCPTSPSVQPLPHEGV